MGQREPYLELWDPGNFEGLSGNAFGEPGSSIGKSESPTGISGSPIVVLESLFGKKP